MDYEKALSHISNTDELLNVRHLYALSGLTRAQFERFRQIWPTIEPRRRQSVMRSLAELTEQSFEVNFDPIFILALGDEDSEVRAAAIEGLWENEDQALIGPLVHLLRADEATYVRAAAAIALGRFVLLGELEEIDRAPAMFWPNKLCWRRFTWQKKTWKFGAGRSKRLPIRARPACVKSSKPPIITKTRRCKPAPCSPWAAAPIPIGASCSFRS